MGKLYVMDRKASNVAGQNAWEEGGGSTCERHFCVKGPKWQEKKG